jgi:hypothetical protein
MSKHDEYHTLAQGARESKHDDLTGLADAIDALLDENERLATAAVALFHPDGTSRDPDDLYARLDPLRVALRAYGLLEDDHE